MFNFFLQPLLNLDSENSLFALMSSFLSSLLSVSLSFCYFYSPSFLEAIWLLHRVVEYPSEPRKAFGPCASVFLTGPRARRCCLYFPLIGLEIIAFHRWMAKPQQSGERVTALSHRLSWVLMLLQQLLGSVLLTSSHLLWRKQQIKDTWEDAWPSLPGMFSLFLSNWLAI